MIRIYIFGIMLTMIRYQKWLGTMAINSINSLYGLHYWIMLKYAESFPGLHQVSPNIFDIHIMGWLIHNIPLNWPIRPSTMIDIYMVIAKQCPPGHLHLAGDSHHREEEGGILRGTFWMVHPGTDEVWAQMVLETFMHVKKVGKTTWNPAGCIPIGP